MHMVAHLRNKFNRIPCTEFGDRLAKFGEPKTRNYKKPVGYWSIWVTERLDFFNCEFCFFQIPFLQLFLLYHDISILQVLIFQTLADTISLDKRSTVITFLPIFDFPSFAS